MQTTLYIVVVALVAASTNSSPTHHSAIRHQVKALQQLGCEPHLQKVKVLDLANDLWHARLFFPQAVAVRRCDEECSFCGTSTGTITGRCVARQSEEKSFDVVYYEDDRGKHHRTISVVDHLSCHCKS